MWPKQKYSKVLNEVLGIMTDTILKMRLEDTNHKNIIGSVKLQRRLHSLYEYMDHFEDKVYSNVKLSKHLKPLLWNKDDLPPFTILNDFHGFEMPKVMSHSHKNKHKRTQSGK